MANQTHFLMRAIFIFLTVSMAILKPTLLRAAEAVDNKAFEARDTAGALAALGVQNPGAGKRILLEVPEIVDKDAIASIKVKSAIPNTDWIAVLIDKKQFPMVGQYNLSDIKKTEIEVNVKFIQTSTVIAVVRADGKYYRVDKEVKVAIPLDNRSLK